MVESEGVVRHELVAGHTLGQRLQESDGVFDDLGARGLVPVHEPLREFEFGVQPGTLAQQPVRRPDGPRRVGGVDVFGGGRRRGEPLQIGRRIADLQAMPLEQTGHRRASLDVFEQERRGPCSAQHDGGLEAPQHIGGDGATPPRDERRRRRVGRLGAVDQAVGVVADLLRRAHRQALGPDDRQRKGVQRGEGFTHRRRGARDQG